MNVIQIIRRARLGVDAILPGGNISAQWTDEELVSVANAAYDEIWRLFRLARKKWGLRTLAQADPAFTRDGETYTPSTALTLSTSKTTIDLPPDFGELVRIISTTLPLSRFRPAEIESLYWLDREQENRTAGPSDAVVFFYDIVGTRTVRVVPTSSSTINITVEYVPMRWPLYFSTAGTVSQAGTALTGTGTTWLTDAIATEDSGNAAELIPGTNSPTSSIINVNRDYPRVASIAADTTATMVLSATIASGTQAIMAMAPALPRDMHRWMCDYTAAFMLKKINPELAEKYSTEVLQRMDRSIQPTAGRRQLQESPITEGNEEMTSITHPHR